MVKYYSVLRPVGIGTFPKYADNKVIEIVNFDYRKYVPEIEREAWGYIVYESEMSDKDALSYDLIRA
jgi:hypothetical protein